MGDNIKFYLANISAIVLSLSDIEQILQVLVLSATLIYTITKAIRAVRDFKK